MSAPRLTTVLFASYLVFLFVSVGNSEIVSLADPDFNAGNSLDSWDSNMVIQESYSYTNSSSGAKEICVMNWSFDAGVDRGRATPFIVRLNDANLNGNLYDDNDFEVMWTGNTSVSDSAAGGVGMGDWGTGDVGSTVSFTESGCFMLGAGETIAIGFLNSNPQGLETGDPGSVITWNSGAVAAGEMWYNGNGNPNTYPNGVLTDVMIGGDPAASVQDRSYNFGIQFEANAVPEPGSGTLFLSLLGLGVFRRRK